VALAVQLAGFIDQAEGIDAVDLACHAAGYARNGAKAFCEVEQAIYTPGVVIEQEQQRTGAVFRPREKRIVGASRDYRDSRLAARDEFRN
jgi:hypothetical protein